MEDGDFEQGQAASTAQVGLMSKAKPRWREYVGWQASSLGIIWNRRQSSRLVSGTLGLIVIGM